MTDRGAFLGLLLLCLSVSALVSCAQFVAMVRPWWIAYRDQTNGPETALLRGMFRRRFTRILKHVALLVMSGYRVILGRPAPPWMFALGFLLIVACLIFDTVSDEYDFRLLRRMFRYGGRR